MTGLRILAPISFVLCVVVPVGAQQPASAAPPSPPRVGSSAFQGALPHDALRPEPINLSLQEAIDRGLRYNVGLLISGKASDQARAARLAQLSQLLPQVNASLRETEQNTNLRALGISFFPGIPTTVTVANFDARASVSAPLVDLHARSALRADAETVVAADWDSHDARETVVLAVASAYLQTIATQSALAAVQADLQIARELFRVASARESAGSSPQLDTLRAQVEMQSRQQAATQAQNALDKQQLVLLRIIGLPLRQQIVMTSLLPYTPLPERGRDDAVARALATRADYKSAEARVRAADLVKRAAARERLPTLTVSGDYGALGTTAANALPTWSATAIVRAPVFDGGRIRADVLQANAALEQRQAELADLRVGIEQDVAGAILDIQAAAQQVDVAKSSVDYAQRALTQAQQRFAAGFANNLEVIQAQEALVTANNQYVNALYAHNLAKLTLARAMGSAESDLNTLFALNETRAD